MLEEEKKGYAEIQEEEDKIKASAPEPLLSAEDKEFMEKEDINDYFQASDIGMLYAPTADSKGSSAVVKEYVAGRLGLIASHIRHYSDLKKGLLYVQSGDIHAIIYKTLSTLTDPIALSKLKHEQNENYKEINYTRVSLKHAHLYHEVLSQ